MNRFNTALFMDPSQAGCSLFPWSQNPDWKFRSSDLFQYRQVCRLEKLANQAINEIFGGQGAGWGNSLFPQSFTEIGCGQAASFERHNQVQILDAPPVPYAFTKIDLCGVLNLPHSTPIHRWNWLDRYRVFPVSTKTANPVQPLDSAFNFIVMKKSGPKDPLDKPVSITFGGHYIAVTIS